MTGHVVCFGEVLLRLATPGARLLVQCDTLDITVGGAEANVATGLTSLGHHVKMLTRLPAGPLGDKARAALAAAGVDTSLVSRGGGRMGLYFLESGAGPRTSSITYDRAGSAFATSSTDAFGFASALKGARLLHLSGITPALGHGGVALAQAAVAAADVAGVSICFDGNYRSLLWDAWDSNARDILNGLIRSATIMIGNHRDFSLLLGRSFSGDRDVDRREAAEAAFAAFPKLELIASTARTIVDTGHHRIAARLDARSGAHQTEEVDVRDIVDRIGTGDAFAAGLLHKWLLGASLKETAEAGLAYCVLKHTQPGDMCLLGVGELELFSSHGGDVRR